MTTMEIFAPPPMSSKRSALIVAVVLILVSSSCFVEAELNINMHHQNPQGNENAFTKSHTEHHNTRSSHPSVSHHSSRPPLSHTPIHPDPHPPKPGVCTSYHKWEGRAFAHTLRCNETHRYCCGECSHRYCCGDPLKEVKGCEPAPSSNKFLNTMVWIVCIMVIFTMCMLLLLIAKLKINRNVRNLQSIPSFSPHVNRYRRANTNANRGLSMNVFQSDDLPPAYDTLNLKEMKQTEEKLASYDQLQIT